MSPQLKLRWKSIACFSEDGLKVMKVVPLDSPVENGIGLIEDKHLRLITPI